MCPIVWFNILPNFNIDILALPIIWFLIKFNDEKKYLNFFLLSVVLVNIKFFFFTILLGFFLYNFFSGKIFNKAYLTITIIHLIYFLTIFFIFFGFDKIGAEIYNFSI